MHSLKCLRVRQCRLDIACIIVHREGRKEKANCVRYALLRKCWAQIIPKEGVQLIACPVHLWVRIAARLAIPGVTLVRLILDSKVLEVQSSCTVGLSGLGQIWIGQETGAAQLECCESV